jgi:transposase
MKKQIRLTQEERQELIQMNKSGNHSARVLGRARILLLLDHNQEERRKPQEIADAMMVSMGTVYNIRKRYLEGGLEQALYDRPRPGAVPKINGEVEAHLLAITCSEPPEEHEHWTLRLLANKLVELELVESISHVAVGEVLKKTRSNRGK